MHPDTNRKAVQSSTLVKLGDVGSAPVVLALVGILIVATLWHYRVKGSILIGILATMRIPTSARTTGAEPTSPSLTRVDD